jgi:hypothetical protein
MVPTSARSVPLHASDSLEVPVCVTAGIPLRGRRRPHPSVVDQPHAAWPGYWPPPDGWYDVPATWREIVDSAVTVGRDPSPWLSRYPALATNELLARVAPLAAYLHHDGLSSPAKLRASPVYSLGAERSAQGAMAYRLGMTMAEWVARSLIGLPATTHHEDAQPTGAGSEWFGPGRRPDLWSEDSRRSPAVWSIEAKAARRLAQRNMREGAEQLASLNASVLPVSHSRVLVGTSIDDRLFTLVEHEVRDQRAATADGDTATGLFNVARARLIIYLFLREQGYERLRTVTVARADEEARFSETDDLTREVRGALRDRLHVEDRGPLPPDLAPRCTEFLTSGVPGTGLRVGLSPGLFRACQGLLATLQNTAAEVATERPDWAKYGDKIQRVHPARFDLSEEAEAERIAEFKEALDQRTRSQRGRLVNDYELGARAGVAISDYPERENVTDNLEMYSNDIYVALDPDSVLMGPLRRA